jgi:hypothetical protein
MMTGVATPFNSWGAVAPIFDSHGAGAYAGLSRAAAADSRWSACPSPLAALHAVRVASFAGRATDPFGGDSAAFLHDLNRLESEVDAAVTRGLVQFTEPLRVADVLPGLLLAARWADGRPLRLVEIGCSVGLLLVPEVLRISYPRCVWDPPTAAASITTDLNVPPQLLQQPLDIVDRVGVDLEPVDPEDPEAYDYLRAFAWPGDPAREQRLAGALTALRTCPAPLVRADAITALPDLVSPDRNVVTVVIESTLSTYLTNRQGRRLSMALDMLSARTHLLFLTRGPNPDDPVLTGKMSLIDLSRRHRLTYSTADMLSERTQWVGSR